MRRSGGSSAGGRGPGAAVLAFGPAAALGLPVWAITETRGRAPET